MVGSPIMSERSAIILAAGQGTRMKSKRAKVLFEVAGRPILHHVIHAALGAGIGDVVVVVGFDGENVARSLAGFGERVRTVVQRAQKGTGHAVGCALPALRDAEGTTLVLCGDTPLLEPADLEPLARDLPAEASLALLTCKVPDPRGYGRILRDREGRVVAIREHRDCSDAERAIDEINLGMYAVRTSFLRGAVGKLQPNNAQGERYFTDVVAEAARSGGAVGFLAKSHVTLAGINDRAQLEDAEAFAYRRAADRLRRAGVTIRGDARIDAGVVVEPDATIESGVVLRGATVVRSGAHVDVGAVLTDVTVGEGTKILPYSVLTRSTVGPGAQIGPFSHVRPESEIGEGAHIGNFVETKKTIVRRGAKANHLAYLGDGDIGEGANVGAGTIFCNYDGYRKHRTEIGEGAFIGSDSQLVAPVKIGRGAYVATGTTVTKDVPDDALAIARVRQENKEGYATKLKARLKASK
jgi:bifunctional UDP-N-acetylglucosamine pyrophosphorylase/glucosamine-1-phosphate N-acetyltransferase